MLFIVVLAMVGGLTMMRRGTPNAGTPPPATAELPSAPSSLRALLTLPPGEVPQCGIAHLNLLCAEGLPGAEGLDVRACEDTLNPWAERVDAETARHLHRFRDNPAEFDQSEGFFRLLLMAVVLAEDLQVRYNPARMAGPGQASTEDGFFADSRDVFLHGLLGPRRLGTCSSLPVLYVALGRRLGYPVSLVTTKGHLFVRWESDRERFNVECTGRGLEHFNDEHYRQWPFQLTDEEIEANGYLKSLGPAEELAVFLSIRAQCLREANRTPEAVAACQAAIRLAPHVASYRLLLADVGTWHTPAARPFLTVADLPRGFPRAGSSLTRARIADPNPLRQVQSPAPTPAALNPLWPTGGQP